MQKLSCVLIAVSLALAPACVTSGTHKKQMTAAKKAHDDEMAAANKRETDLSTKNGDLTKENETCKSERLGLQKNVDIITATNVAMEDRLKQLGQNVSSLSTQNKIVSAQLDELRRQKAAAEARLAVFR